MAKVFDTEALFARLKWNDETAARIWESGAIKYREMAEMWKQQQ